MKLAIFTILALNVDVSFADGDAAGIRGTIRAIPKLLGAEQLVDVGKHNDVQPDYCYADPDWYCYRKGHPKCCTKSKGNCPGGQPGCECGDQSCNPDTDNESPTASPSEDNDNNRIPDRCKQDGDCARSEYCRFGVGKCGRDYGICDEMPERCSREEDPVCGCNGRTYNNDCLAADAGVSVQFYGECEEDSKSPTASPSEDNNDNNRIPDRCEQDGDCARSEYCRYQVGKCGHDYGICDEMPERCSREDDPVCGCDGRTYSNDCLAADAGVSVQFYGECAVNDNGLTTCMEDDDCGRDEFCRTQTGTCGAREGICRQMPSSRDCTTEIDPVCGCDGREYINDCDALADGVSIKYYGRCSSEDGPAACVEDGNCRDDEYCRFQAGMCGRDQGICEEMPDRCSREEDPVCGCDGRTYSNDCLAADAGVSVQFYGECNGNNNSPTTCMEDNDCGMDEFCRTQTGTCGAREGVCRQIPSHGDCTLELDPVCGCNGHEYANDCGAEAAGVSVKYYGKC